MAETDYDDKLLLSSENTDAVDWDGMEGGLPAEGQHLAVVKKVGGQMKNFATYTSAQAVVQFQIIEGLDKGKTVYDRIALPHAMEEQWKQNKRLLVASRMGLIPKGSKGTHQLNWKILEGRQVLITVEHYEYEKDGKKKKGASLSFDGWEDPASGVHQAASGATQQAQYPDI